MINSRRKLLVIFLVLFVSLNAEGQCAMCRAVLESGEDQSTAEGINNGIIYLMAIPYVLIGGILFYIYKTYSKKTKAN
ncbi:MAG: hypothetical protein KJO22_03510 [Bacteroidia bacterium]|nr:hypothetical protein [Winogradskyella sp.]MBT8375912.1 hypothetical protein [Bacteroidia bacterium]